LSNKLNDNEVNSLKLLLPQIPENPRTSLDPLLFLRRSGIIEESQVSAVKQVLQILQRNDLIDELIMPYEQKQQQKIGIRIETCFFTLLISILFSPKQEQHKNLVVCLATNCNWKLFFQPICFVPLDRNIILMGELLLIHKLCLLHKVIY